MKTILILTALFVMISCNSSKEANGSKSTQKLSENYSVVSIAGIESLATFPTMKFDFTLNKVSGNAGCNEYGGTMIVDGNEIKFSEFRATEMYCDNMDVEQKFLSKLTKVDYFKVEKSQLKMFSQSDELLLVFEEGN